VTFPPELAEEMPLEVGGTSGKLPKQVPSAFFGSEMGQVVMGKVLGFKGRTPLNTMPSTLARFNAAAVLPYRRRSFVCSAGFIGCSDFR
jgi:hypothetical protein